VTNMTHELQITRILSDSKQIKTPLKIQVFVEFTMCLV